MLTHSRNGSKGFDGWFWFTFADFCYTAHVIVEETNVQTLLPAACILHLTEIQNICCEFLKQQLAPSNVLGIRAFADTHACRDLLRVADKFTQHNFTEVGVGGRLVNNVKIVVNAVLCMFSKMCSLCKLLNRAC